MTSAQREAHARILATHTVRTHLRESPIERGERIRGKGFKAHSEAGRKGRNASSVYGAKKKK